MRSERTFPIGLSVALASFLLLLWEGTIYELESSPCQTPKLVSTLILDFEALGSMSNDFLLFINYWIYSILSEQHEPAFWKQSPVGVSLWLIRWRVLQFLLIRWRVLQFSVNLVTDMWAWTRYSHSLSELDCSCGIEYWAHPTSWVELHGIVVDYDPGPRWWTAVVWPWQKLEWVEYKLL